MNLIGAVFAIALFAHQYEVTCQKCHSIVPRLNAFGMRFMANGDRIPGVDPGPAFPISTKVNFAYSSADGGGLPKAIVDEIEVFTAGAIGSGATYFVEQYVIDGGEHGSLREAWIQDRLDSWSSRVPVSIMAGSFTLPLPVDPETFRETAQHYAIFDQTIGDNPFNFFEPKVGLKISAGDLVRGTSVQFAVLNANARMTYAQHAMGPFTVSAYDYQGIGFTRSGYGLTYSQRKWTSENVYSRNGGFTQLRYEIGPRAFVLARYEGTNDPLGLAHDGVILFGYRPSHNARVTIEDVITNTPAATHSLNLQYTVGY